MLGAAFGFWGRANQTTGSAVDGTLKLHLACKMNDGI
jgi:hypothetical protein